MFHVNILQELDIHWNMIFHKLNIYCFVTLLLNFIFAMLLFSNILCIFNYRTTIFSKFRSTLHQKFEMSGFNSKTLVDPAVTFSSLCPDCDGRWTIGAGWTAVSSSWPCSNCHGRWTIGAGCMAVSASWLYHCQKPRYVQLEKYGLKNWMW